MHKNQPSPDNIFCMGSEFTKKLKKKKAEYENKLKKLNMRQRARYSCYECEPAANFKTEDQLEKHSKSEHP